MSEIIEIELPQYHPKGCSCAICQAVDEVLNTIERLQAENAELRAEVEQQREAIANMVEKNTQLCAELEKESACHAGNTLAAIDDYNDALKRIAELEGALENIAERNGDDAYLARAALEEKP